MVIRIQRGDQQTELTVPDRSKVNIGEDGTIGVQLPGAPKSIASSPAAESGGGQTDGAPHRNVTRAAGGLYRLNLPNGAVVEVVAVARDPRHSSCWWKPDGGRLAEPPADQLQFTGKLPAPYRAENEIALPGR